MKTDLWNLCLLLLAVAASVWGATLPGSAAQIRQRSTALAGVPPPGAEYVVDARGVSVPVDDYRRIVSLNTVSDRLLLELVEPERLVAITGFTASRQGESWRFGDRPTVERSDQLERIISLEPDLVIVSRYADEPYMERLREVGIMVLDLGAMLGVESTRANIRTLGALLNVPSRAQRLEDEYVMALSSLWSSVSPSERRPGIYLSLIGEHLSGGSTGTSYADLLKYGGVDDLAEQNGYEGWPRYTPEQLLEMDPPLIVTAKGTGIAIRTHSLLGRLRACGPGGTIIELEPSLLQDSDLGIVHAALLLQRALFQRPAPTVPEPRTDH